MKLMQHEKHGFHWAQPQEEPALLAAGWFAAPQGGGTVPQPSLSPAEPVGAAPKRGPGRPKKQ